MDYRYNQNGKIYNTNNDIYTASNIVPAQSYEQFPTDYRQNAYQPDPNSFNYYPKYDNHEIYDSNNIKAQQNIDLFIMNTNASIYEHGIYQNSRNIMESTINELPNTKKISDQLHLPFGIICTPLLPDTAVYNVAYNKLIRCRYCSAYLNPYVRIIDENSYFCSICYKKNFIKNSAEAEPIYLNNRPELQFPCIEYDSELGNRAVPIPLSLIFLLDISAITEAAYYIDVVAEVLKNFSDQIPGDKRSSITIIAFDSFIHTFQIIETDTGLNAEHLIITDLSEPFLPTHDSCSIRFKSNDHLKILLDKLPHIVESKGSETSENCLGTALDYSIQLLSKSGGGRITAFLLKPPSIGLGSYQPRQENDMFKGNKEESASINPIIDYYRSFGMEALNKNVTIDLFCVNKNSVDLANLIPMCQVTGGEVLIAPSFDTFSYQNKDWLSKNLKIYITRELRLSNLIKIRMNEAFEVQSYFGNFFVASIKKLSIPIINQYTTLVFDLHLEYDPPKDFPYMCFQVSVLSTCVDGANRLRVITISLSLSDYFANIFSSINFPCVFSLITRMAVDRSFQYSISDTKSAIVNVLVDMLKSYQTFYPCSFSHTSFMIPAPVYQLSVLLYSLTKCDAFSLIRKIKIDKRVQKMVSLRTWPIDFTMIVLYPVLYNLSDILPYVSLNDPYFLANPRCFSIPSSCECIYPGKIYILDSGFDVYIYVKSETPNQMINSLIGVATYEFMPDAIISLPMISTELNQFVHHFIELITNNRPYKPNIIIFKESCDAIKQKFSSLLVLDQTDKSGSYKGWIKTIRTKLLGVI